ncbi:sel-10, partial [Symbiodinium natans]
DKTLRRWDLKDSVLLETFPVGDAQIRCLSSPFSPATSVVAGDEKGNLQIWDTKTGAVEKRMSGHTDGVLCVSQVHAGFVVSGGRDGRLCYWRLEDGLCLRSVEVSEVSAGRTTASSSLTAPFGHGHVRQMLGFRFCWAWVV